MYSVRDLLEMTFPREKAEERITGLGQPFVKHLIKVLKWEDLTNYEKHVNDMQSWIDDISDIQIKPNKLPKYKDYFKWIFTDNRVTVDKIKQLKYTYGKLSELQSDEDVIRLILNDIAPALCNDLAQGKIINIRSYLMSIPVK